MFDLHILLEHNSGIKQDLPVVVDKLKTELNESGCYMLGYADNTIILISRKYRLRASKVRLGCGKKLVWNNSVVYQPTKDGDMTIQ